MRKQTILPFQGIGLFDNVDRIELVQNFLHLFAELEQLKGDVSSHDKTLSLKTKLFKDLT